jgi:uncharacterized protein (UPF0261 family)
VKTDAPLSAEKHRSMAIALTMFGVTTPCVQRVREQLDRAGMEAFVFHANGTGGRTVEAFAREGIVDGIVDATITELADELFGGTLPAGPDRLANASRMGIPQVIAPGAIDMINFGPRVTVPPKFQDRVIVSHNDLVTLVRTTPDECFEIGRVVGQRLGEARAGCTVVVPLGGVSMLDKPGGAFWDPSAVAAFRDGLLNTVSSSVEVIATDGNINDPPFADLLVARLKQLLSRHGRRGDARRVSVA